MNKIISGMLSIAMALTLVAGSAYAFFNAQVNINGITLGTATTGLEVKIGNQDEFVTSLTIPDGENITDLVPGVVSDPGVFVYRNTGDIDLRLTSQIHNVGGNWNLLKDKIQAITCRIPLSSYHEHYHCPEAGNNTTGWYTLEHWQNNPVGLTDPYGIVKAGVDDALFITNFRLDAGVDSTVAGKAITGMDINVVGTQVTP